jgi:hypothetical protein
LLSQILGGNLTLNFGFSDKRWKGGKPARALPEGTRLQAAAQHELDSDAGGTAEQLQFWCEDQQ